jgi:hypothetical protein
MYSGDYTGYLGWERGGMWLKNGMDRGTEQDKDYHSKYKAAEGCWEEHGYGCISIELSGNREETVNQSSSKEKYGYDEKLRNYLYHGT